jgi:hypothetical protein
MFRFSKLFGRSQSRSARSRRAVIEALETRVLLANLTSSVRGAKFIDNNGNGALDSGEGASPTERFTIKATIVDANGTSTLTTQTWLPGDAQPAGVTLTTGEFYIPISVVTSSTVPTPTITIQEVLSTGWMQTTPAVPQLFVVANGQQFTPTGVKELNIGNFQNASIGGRKFNDVNGNGVDNSDPGIAGWEVFLDTNANNTWDTGEVKTTTDSSGNYAFTNLAPGTYTVREVQNPAWIQTTTNPGSVTVSSGVTSNGGSFGNFRLQSISGQKFEDKNGNGLKDSGDAGLTGWTIFNDRNNNGAVDIGEESTTTGANGNYSLTVGPGTVRIRELLQTSWVQTTTNPTAFTGTSGTVLANVDFGNFKKYTVTGTKFEDLNGNGMKDPGEPGLSGWTIFNDANNNSIPDAGESTTTGANGVYTLELGPGTYRIREVLQTGWTQTLGVADGTGQSGTNLVNRNIGNFKLVTISGLKFNDINGDQNPAGDPGLGGWTIFDDVNNNGQLDSGEQSTVTAANGTWSFTGVGPRQLRIREVQQTGWEQTTTNPLVFSTVSGQNVANINFGNRLPPERGSISGLKFNDLNGNGVQDTGEPGIENWTIYLDQNQNGQLDSGEMSVKTTSNGNFQFNQLAAGTYRVREVLQTGWQQTTTNPADVVLATGGIRENVLFGNFQQVTISGAKFNDLNANGIRDTGEAGLSGWTIFLDTDNNGVLDPGERQQVTDSNGNYSFTNVGPGTFRLREQAKFNWIQMTANPIVTTTSGVTVGGQLFGNIQLNDIVKLGKLALTSSNLTNFQNGTMASQAQFIANLYLSYKKPSSLTGMCNYLKLFMAGYNSTFVENKFKQDFGIV